MIFLGKREFSYDLLQGKRTEEGQRGFPSSAVFQYQGAILWGGIP
jgi:hypothetical protein